MDKEFSYRETQQVVVNDHISGHTEVTSGVPQGFIIAPYFFVIH